MLPNYKLYTQFRASRKYGYRSGLEHKLSLYLDKLKAPYCYENMKIEWEDLAYRTYTPDFILNNGIIIETKGLFTAADRRKHIEIKRQHPKLDIRFVFTNSNRKLRKNAKSTYGEWCIKYGIPYADRVIPQSWIKKKGKAITDTFIVFKGKKIKRS